MLLVLVAPALDVLALAQPRAALNGIAMVACTVAAGGLAFVWLRQPTSFSLAAAALTFVLSAALRWLGVDGQAVMLSLAGILALGVGGAFGSSGSPTALLDALDGPEPATPLPAAVVATKPEPPARRAA
jgi:hypothetical protein